MDESNRSNEIQPSNWDKLLQQFSNSISSQSPKLQLQALITFIRLSPQAPQPILTPTFPLLINLLHQTLEPTIQQATAYSLLLLTHRFDEPFTPILGQLGVIPIVLGLIPASRDVHRRCLLKCLSRIVAFDIPNRMILLRNGGLGFVLNQISICNDDTRKYLLEILSSLAMLREVRRAIVVDGRLRFIVEAVTSGKLVSRTRAAQAVGLLGIAKRVRPMLVELGAVEALVGLFRDGDASGRIVAGNALGVVCAHIDHVRLAAQFGVIPLYIELLRGREAIEKEIVEDMFCLLAMAEENLVLILDQLVGVLKGNDGQDVKGAAIDVIWDLSSHKHSVSIVIPVLIEILRDGCLDLREKASAVITQLSYNNENRSVMAEGGIIPVLTEFLRGDLEELKEFAVETLINLRKDSRFRERASGAVQIPSFLVLQERLSRIFDSIQID